MPFYAPALLSLRCHNYWPCHHRRRPRNACASSPPRTRARSTIRALGNVVLSPLPLFEPPSDCPRMRSVFGQFIRTGSVCRVDILRSEASSGGQPDSDQRRAFGGRIVDPGYLVSLGLVGLPTDFSQ